MLDIVKSEFGGHMTHRIELIENLNKLGHEVHAIVSDEDIAKRMQSEGIIVHRIKINNKFLLPLNYIKTLLNIRFKYQLDIIYGRTSLFGLLGMLIWFKQKTKLVKEVNSSPTNEEWKLLQYHFQDYSHNLIGNLWMRLLSHLNYLTSKNAAIVRTVTEKIKNELIFQGIDSKKIFVIENGANIDMFNPMDPIIVKNILCLDRKTHYISFVGGFLPYQGVEYLIMASQTILKEVKNTQFLIVGEGIMKEKYIGLTKKLKVESEFIFMGAVPYKEVPKYISASDICVAPFIKERNEKIGLSPLKLYEYLSCGKPVVASNIKGVGNLLGDSNSGIIVEPENPEELAKAIIKLLKDKKLREKMGRNGREYVVKYHSWRSVAEKVAEVCKILLK